MLAQHGAQPGRTFECRAGLCEHDRAGNDVGVSVQVLGGRVQDHVGTEPDRPAEHGRGYGRVDRQQRAGRMGDARYLGDVGDRPQRVGGSLDPDEPGVPGAGGSLQGRGVAGIDEGRLDAVARRILRQPLPQAPVHGRGRDHVSGTFEREEGGGRRSHAGREQSVAWPSSSRSAHPRPAARWRCPNGHSSSLCRY